MSYKEEDFEFINLTGIYNDKTQQNYTYSEENDIIQENPHLYFYILLVIATIVIVIILSYKGFGEYWNSLTKSEMIINKWLLAIFLFIQLIILVYIGYKINIYPSKYHNINNILFVSSLLLIILWIGIFFVGKNPTLSMIPLTILLLIISIWIMTITNNDIYSQIILVIFFIILLYFVFVTNDISRLN